MKRSAVAALSPHQLRVLAVMVVPVALTFAATATIMLQRRGPTLACWILPTAMVSFGGALDPACPLNAYERIVSIHSAAGAVAVYDRDQLLSLLPRSSGALELTTLESGRRRRRSIPVIDDPAGVRIGQLIVAGALSFALVSLGVSILVRRGGSAATPIGLLCSFSSVYLIATLCRASTPALDASGLLAQGMLPAALCHLAFVFPRERKVVERAPGILTFVYVAAASLVLFEFAMLTHQNILWEVADRITGTLTLAGVLCLGASSYLTLHESDSPRERTQASILLASSAAFVALFGVLALGVADALPLAMQRTIATSVILAIVGATCLVSRFALLDVPLAVRWGASYVIYTAVVATALYVGCFAAREWLGWTLPSMDPAILFGTVFVTLVILEWIRHWSWGVVENWVTPWAPRLEALRASYAREAGRSQDADEIVTRLAETVQAALNARSASGFLVLNRTCWRLAAAVGRSPCENRLADTAADLLRDVSSRSSGRHEGPSGILYLDQMPGQADPRVGSLKASGVDLLAGVVHDGDLVALLLVASDKKTRLYSSDHLAFLEQTCLQPGMAIGNAHLQFELTTSARMAAMGHAAAGLAHDLGRPIGEIFLEARKAAAQHRASGARPVDAQTIRELAAECLDHLDRFVAEGKGADLASTGSTNLSVVLEAATDRIARLYQDRRPLIRLAPRLPRVADAQNVQRVVENLLENATEWNVGDFPVELYANMDGGEIVIRVIDHGPGIDDDFLPLVFYPCVSGRRSSGMGLAVCKNIVDGLGGTIRLSTSRGRGTEVTVRLPHRNGAV